MSVLGVGRFDGKGDKYEVQVFMILYYIILIIYLLLMCWPFSIRSIMVNKYHAKFFQLHARVRACVHE